MALILDTGALIGYERRSIPAVVLLDRARLAGETLRTTTAVVAQAWRGGLRQARLVMLLRSVEEFGLDPAAARRIGILLRDSHSADIVDASVMDIAHRGDRILTSDPDDIAALALAADKIVTVIPLS